MIITKTPFRISFFGGGTDYPDWFKNYGGAVLSTTIDKYCYISIRYLPPFFEHKHRIIYSLVETVNAIEDIRHPVVRAVLSESDLDRGYEVHHDGDLPARSGLGSSSSFAVGMLHALASLEGRMIQKHELASEAIRMEQTILNENVGCQDQVGTAYGGFNRIGFNQDSSFLVKPIVLTRGKLEVLNDSLMLFFTGFTRYASQVARETIDNIDDRKNELREILSMVDEAIEILDKSQNLIFEFGKLLHRSWELKQRLASSISTPEINEIYDTAMDAGAIGGKLLGAGGGGFMVFVVRPENQEKVAERLKNLVKVNFKFEIDGSKLMVYEPETNGIL